MPSDISHLALVGERSPELALHRLQAELPASYSVFHGIHWSREYRNGIKFGELDFVIVNQAGNVLVIEQKNGRLEESQEDGLVKNYPDRAKPVATQVRRTLDGVREKFKLAHHYQADLDLDYLIYCPDYRIRTSLRRSAGARCGRPRMTLGSTCRLKLWFGILNGLDGAEAFPA